MPLTRPFVVALLIVLPCASGAQVGRITGATIATNGNPIGEVQVQLVGTTFGAVSGGGGGYTIENIPPGTYTARAQKIGYSPILQQVVVNSGQTTALNFVLSSTVVVVPSLISADDPAVPLPPDSLKYPVPDSAIIRQRQSEGRPAVAALAGQRIEIALFKDLTLTVDLEETSRTSTGVNASGTVISGTGARIGLVTIVIRNNRVIANIRQGLRLYQIRPQARGIHLIVEVDQSKLPARNTP